MEDRKMEELDLIDETDLYEKESSMVRLDNRTILSNFISKNIRKINKKINKKFLFFLEDVQDY